MSNGFDFSIDTVEGKRPAARAVAVLFGGALILLSAATSAAFFASYVPDLYSLWVGSWSPLLSAATGVLIFEVGALAWGYLRSHHADTGAQLVAARVGSWGGMIGGVLVTVAYFSLSNRLLVDNLDAATLDLVALMGGVLVVAGVAGHFILVFLYQSASAAQQQAASAADLRAMSSAARNQVDAATMRATLDRTLADIGAALPVASARQGATNAQRYLAHSFEDAPTPSTPARPTMTANGRGG